MELSELQLPALSRGTTVAVYTNVTSDHLDRHGSVEAYRRVKRRLAELVDPDGALVLNLEDPVVGGYAGLGTAPAVLYRVDRPVPGGLGVVDGWIVAAAVERLPLAGGGTAMTAPGGGIMPVDELGIPGAHNVSNALAAIAVGLLFGIAPDAIRRAAAGFTGVEHRLQSVALVDGVRFVNDSQGTQPDAVIAALRAFPPPVVLIAGGRDKGVDLSELARVVGHDRRGRGAHRRERPDARGACSATPASPGPRAPRRWTRRSRPRTALAREALLDRAEGSVATVVLSPAAASFDMFEDYAARGRAFIAAVGAARTGRPADGHDAAHRAPQPRPRTRRRRPSSASATSPSTGSSSRSSPSRPSAS